MATGRGGHGGMGLPYVPLTFPTITVQENAGTAGVTLSIAEVDKLWDIYKDAVLNKGYAAYNPAAKDFVPLLNYLVATSDFTKLKVVGWLNALYTAVNDQGWGYMWLDPKAAAATTNPIVDPIGAIKKVAGDAGTAVSNFLTPVADPLTNLIKWGAILVVGGATIYAIYEGHKYFKGRKKRRKG